MLQTLALPRCARCAAAGRPSNVSRRRQCLRPGELTQEAGSSSPYAAVALTGALPLAWCGAYCDVSTAVPMQGWGRLLRSPVKNALFTRLARCVRLPSALKESGFRARASKCLYMQAAGSSRAAQRVALCLSPARAEVQVFGTLAALAGSWQRLCCHADSSAPTPAASQ